MNAWKLLVPLTLAVAGCQLCSLGDAKPTRPPATSSGAAPNRPGVIPVSRSNASIEFTGSTSLMSQTGHFEAFDGTVEVPTDDPKDMKARVTVDMDSTTTKIGLLTKHLKGEDFFDVARFPKAEFLVDGVSPSGEAGRYQVSGKLTIHGVQQSIAFPARIAITPEEVSFDATMTISQTGFGMTEAAKKTKDEVPVRVSIHGRRK